MNNPNVSEALRGSSQLVLCLAAPSFAGPARLPCQLSCLATARPRSLAKCYSSQRGHTASPQLGKTAQACRGRRFSWSLPARTAMPSSGASNCGRRSPLPLPRCQVAVGLKCSMFGQEPITRSGTVGRRLPSSISCAIQPAKAKSAGISRLPEFSAPRLEAKRASTWSISPSFGSKYPGQMPTQVYPEERICEESSVNRDSPA